MTHAKQIRVMAAMKTAYARNIHVTMSAGSSRSQNRMTPIVLPEAA
jgi:flagellar biosynthesis chaperone FliJ